MGIGASFCRSAFACTNYTFLFAGVCVRDKMHWEGLNLLVLVLKLHFTSYCHPKLSYLLVWSTDEFLWVDVNSLRLGKIVLYSIVFSWFVVLV